MCSLLTVRARIWVVIQMVLKREDIFHLSGQPHRSTPGVNLDKEDIRGIKDRTGQSVCLFVVNDHVQTHKREAGCSALMLRMRSSSQESGIFLIEPIITVGRQVCHLACLRISYLPNLYTVLIESGKECAESLLVFAK